MMHGCKYGTDTSNLKKMLVAKFFNSSTMKIRKLLGYKTFAFSERIMNYVTFCMRDDL